MLGLAQTVAQIRQFGQHSKIFEVNVLLGEVNTEPTGLVVEWPFMLPPQDLLADLTMAPVEIVGTDGHRHIEITSPF